MAGTDDRHMVESCLILDGRRTTLYGLSSYNVTTVTRRKTMTHDQFKKQNIDIFYQHFIIVLIRDRFSLL